MVIKGRRKSGTSDNLRGDPVPDSEITDINNRRETIQSDRDTRTDQKMETKMSIFGNLDTSNIPDDPFMIPANTYWCVVTESTMVEKDDGNVQFTIKWGIDDPSSDYHGKPLTEFYTIYPGTSWENLTGKQREAYTWLKRRLRRGFGLSEGEINTVSPSDLVGKGAFVTSVRTEGTGENTGRWYNNIRDALCKELYEEENGTQAKGFGI